MVRLRPHLGNDAPSAPGGRNGGGGVGDENIVTHMETEADSSVSASVHLSRRSQLLLMRLCHGDEANRF